MLYTPGEICSKLDGVNPRMIADMAEKGLVTPVKDSSGGGTSRLYDKEGVFRIVLLSAMRGTFSLKTQSVFLKRILDSAGCEDKLMLFEDLKHGYYPKTETVVCEPQYHTVAGKDASRNPKSYITHSVDIKGIREFVDKNF